MNFYGVDVRRVLGLLRLVYLYDPFLCHWNIRHHDRALAPETACNDRDSTIMDVSNTDTRDSLSRLTWSILLTTVVDGSENGMIDANTFACFIDTTVSVCTSTKRGDQQTCSMMYTESTTDTCMAQNDPCHVKSSQSTSQTFKRVSK